MKNYVHAFQILITILFIFITAGTLSAQTFVVTETDDPTPDGCDSGTDCSLREAIIAANDVGSGTATIQLGGGETYTLSIVNPDPGTDGNSPDETSGSLKILNTDATVRIEATGSGMATIDANEVDRVFIIYPGTDVEIDELEITGGKPAGTIAGGMLVFNNNNLEITNSSISGNSAGDGNSWGGGIWAEGATITITGSTISNNTAGFQGGGIRITDGDEGSNITIQNSVITNNDGGGWSGGIHTENSDLTIIESTISENQSNTFGGGIRISSGNIIIERSAIINNYAQDQDNGNTGGLGGGMNIDGGDVLIINTTISGNEAGNGVNSGTAGGMYLGNFSDAVVDIVNSTITDNTGWSIGGIYNGTGTINMSNSIIANQAAGDDCSGTINSNGYNISSDDSCEFTETGDQQNIDPLLGTLQDNGGPVFTHALSTDPFSPAINNGSNTHYTDAGGDLANDSDANGNDRVYDFGSGGIIDIGAFEVQQNVGIAGCPATSEVLYVKKGENGSGANWFDALGELRDALALFEDETCTTADVEEIWVTAGTYLPTDDSGNREATFLMPGVNIYGGFEGDETNTNQRDLDSNISILSGHINNDGDDLAGNSYHVVTSMDESSAVLFDFTITGGNANDSDPHDKGGGLYASNGGISMSNVLFENNYAETAGGGAYVIETEDRIGAQHPRFFRTIFRNNESGEDGGGLALENAESRISAVMFENNSAGRYGGGLYNDQSDPVLKNVIFRENSADSEGGGILNNLSSPELFNVLITDNDAFVNGGGMVNATNSGPVLTNVTIFGNDAEVNNGGGIYNRNGAAPILLNTIVWGNTASGTGNEIWNSSNSTIELNFSLYSNETGDIVEGDGFTVTNSLTSDPVFSNPGSQDLTLQSTSPAINMGDPDTELSDFRVLTSDAIDLAENPRIYNSGSVGIIDIGAYEFQGEPEDQDAPYINLTGTPGFRMLSAPVEVTLADLLGPLWTQGAGAADHTGGDPNVWTWDNSVAGEDPADWVPVTDLSATVTAGTGVLVYVFDEDEYGDPGSATWPKTLSVSGTANTLPETPPINTNPSGFTLLGNPVNTGIDWDEFILTQVESTVYVWDPATGNYVFWNGSTGGLTNGIIHPFQGFFVQTSPGASSPSLDIPASAATSPDDFFGKEPADEPLVVRLHMKGETGLESTAWLQFSGQGSLSRNSTDAVKLQPLSADYAVLGLEAPSDDESSLLALKHLPLEMNAPLEIPLTATATQGGTFTLAATDMTLPEGWSLTLRDIRTGEKISVEQGMEYTFEVESDKATKDSPLKRGARGGAGLNPRPLLTAQAKITSGTDGVAPHFLLTITPAGVVEADLPARIALEQNYPNPFNPATVISYHLPAVSQVRLEVYDMVGRRVATLVDAQVGAGAHQVTFDAGNLSSGIYLYRLQTADAVFTKKLTLIK